MTNEKNLKDFLESTKKNWNEYLEKNKKEDEVSEKTHNELMVEKLLPLVEKTLENDNFKLECENLLNEWNTDDFKEWDGLKWEKHWLNHLLNQPEPSETITEEQKKKITDYGKIKDALGIDEKKDLAEQLNSWKKEKDGVGETIIKLESAERKLVKADQTKKELEEKNAELIAKIAQIPEEKSAIRKELQKEINELKEQLKEKDKEKDAALSEKQKTINELKNKLTKSNSSSIKITKKANEDAKKLEEEINRLKKQIDEKEKELLTKLQEWKNKEEELRKEQLTRLEAWTKEKEELENNREEMQKRSNDKIEELTNEINQLKEELDKNNKVIAESPKLPIVRPSGEQITQLEGYLQKCMAYLKSDEEDSLEFAEQQKDEEEKNEWIEKAQAYQKDGEEIQAFVEVVKKW